MWCFCPFSYGHVSQAKPQALCHASPVPVHLHVLEKVPTWTNWPHQCDRSSILRESWHCCLLTFPQPPLLLETVVLPLSLKTTAPSPQPPSHLLFTGKSNQKIMSPSTHPACLLISTWPSPLILWGNCSCSWPRQCPPGSPTPSHSHHLKAPLLGHSHQDTKKQRFLSSHEKGGKGQRAWGEERERKKMGERAKVRGRRRASS
jgi:hypothetical protein